MHRAKAQDMAYEASARYYDLLYAWKNYKQETAQIRRLIRKYKKSSGRELLEVACGTGGHARHLQKHFSVVGTDINPGMLRIARRNIKGVQFQQADMLHLDLGRKFDVVLCLFSSIGYMKTYATLKRTLGNFARHLKRGGVVIIEPWFSKSEFKGGGLRVGTFGDKKTKIARVIVSEVRDQSSIMNMHHFVAEHGKHAKYFWERHKMGMFGRDEFLRLMKGAGLRPRFLRSGFEHDRGLFIGVKK